jgi:hypothetical protein
MLNTQQVGFSQPSLALTETGEGGKVEAISTDLKLRRVLDQLLETLSKTMCEHLSQLLKLSNEKELAKIDKVFEQLKVKAQAENGSFFSKLFMKIAMAFAIIVVALLPINPVLSCIVIGIMAAQLAGEIQKDVTGKSFFEDALKGMCGGNADVAKWFGMGLTIGLMVVTCGAGAVGTGGVSLVSGIASLFTKLQRSAAAAGEAAGQGTKSAQSIVSRLIKEAKADPAKFATSLAATLQTLTDSVVACFTIKENTLKIKIAHLQNLIDKLTADIELLENKNKRLLKDSQAFQESKTANYECLIADLNTSGSLNISGSLKMS